MGQNPSVLQLKHIASKVSDSDQKREGLKPADQNRREIINRSEKDLHREIRNLLNLHGIPFCESRMDSKSSITPGWPDVTFAWKGEPVAWELKFLGSLSLKQMQVKTDMERCGWHYRLIRTLGEAINHLREIDGEGA